MSQIGANALNLGVPALNVKGAAPEAFADEVRRPDAVFVAAASRNRECSKRAGSS